MPHVTVELGVTIPFPDSRFGQVSPRMRIEDIDTDGDVEAQIALSVATGEKAWFAIDENLEVNISKLLAPHSGVPAIPDQLKELQREMAGVKENIKRIATKLGGKVPEIATAVKEKAKDGEAKPTGG